MAARLIETLRPLSLDISSVRGSTRTSPIVKPSLRSSVGPFLFESTATAQHRQLAELQGYHLSDVELEDFGRGAGGTACLGGIARRVQCGRGGATPWRRPAVRRACS